jgi:hypothetical protein
MDIKETWSRTSWADAAQIAQMIDPDKVPQGAAALPPHGWFAQLLAAGRLNEAVMFIAHALPRYECIIWMTQSLIEMGAVDRRDPLVVAVLRWIDQPTDELRREAAALAEKARGNSAAKQMAEAVMLSGGSLAPADLPPVQPPPDVCAKLASGAVLTGVYSLSEPKPALRRALELGEAIARGR